MSAARAPGGLCCKWIVSIKSHSAGRTKWIASSLRRFFFFFFYRKKQNKKKTITSRWVMVVKCLTASLPRQKKEGKAWARRPKLLSFSVLRTHSDRYIQGHRGAKLSEICPVSTVDPCQSASQFQSEVGRGRCLARYNYTAKLSLSAWDNGR